MHYAYIHSSHDKESTPQIRLSSWFPCGFEPLIWLNLPTLHNSLSPCTVPSLDLKVPYASNLLPRSCLYLLALLELSGTMSRAALSSSGCFYSHNQYSTRLGQGLCPPLSIPYSISKLLFLPITKFPHGKMCYQVTTLTVLVVMIYLLLAPILMS